MPTLNYGDLGWVKIEGYPPWPVRRADSYEVDSTIRAFERDDLILVYFFGYENYAWTHPSSICDYKEEFNENPSQILQKALDEAFQWQLAEASKVPTRRKNVQNDSRNSRKGKKMYTEEMKQHHKVLMKMMKDELKRWEREMNYRGSDSEDDEESEEGDDDDDDDESIEIKEDIGVKKKINQESSSNTTVINENNDYKCLSCYNELKPLKKDGVKKDLNSLCFYEEGYKSSSLPFGIYSFYMIENHIYNLKNQNKIINCPYINCNESFYFHFEMMEHIKRSHLKNLFNNNNNISMTYYCDYPGCSMKFDGPNGRIKRRHHIETDHLNIEQKQCVDCDHIIFSNIESPQQQDNQDKKEVKRKGRGRGRPKKKKTITKPVLETQPVKKRGRPSTKLYKDNETVSPQPKRRPGRPKKVIT